MGLLALDVTRYGLVMSSDSQDVLLTENNVRPLPMGARRKDKIICFTGTRFSALIGYVGTEEIGPADLRTWLERFGAAHQDSGIADFCDSLRSDLSSEWEAHGLDSCLWVFVAAYDDEPRFWYVVNNAPGADGAGILGTYAGITRTFRCVDDLDENYVSQHLRPGITKTQVLDQLSFHFRNGALLPAAPIFDAFGSVMDLLVFGRLPGFPRRFSLERYAYVARQRMEFVKRLYSPEHGIFSPIGVPAIAGTVNVYTLGPGKAFTKHPKKRSQSRPIP